MNKRSSFFAHSTQGVEREWQLLSDHLKSVGALAAAKAASFNAQDLAEICGLLHDLGKYCAEFQQRLRGSGIRVDHATWGARIVLKKYPGIGLLLAYGIAGHHAGLADGLPGERQAISSLKDRLDRDPLTHLDEVWKREIELNPNPAMPSIRPQQGLGAFSVSVLGRMLYSCLVDADFLDTEAFYRRIEGLPPRDESFPSLVELQSELNTYLEQDRFRSDRGVNRLRKNILRHVRQGAELEPGLFSLNVPTGGGKTLTSLAFALDHAIRHGQRRVILVIPFTSIVEQNARVYREALGDLGRHAVLEHHSAFDQDKQTKADPDARDKLRQAAENWEAPIVVTTAVQFFESLYANRSSRCRKLHNIANSVVILDEAQTLPNKLLRPCVAMIKELALNYRTSLVLCTATQPALLAESGFEHGLEQVRELAPEPVQLHKDLERVTVEHVGELTDEALVEELLQHDQVLCIVNNRRQARQLYERLRDQEGAAHLTTLMCAAHRSVKLDEVRTRLREGMPCRLISTSLIEAGVDVDFPMVYRADAGLDSVAQAAGRCNREGKRAKEDSLVRVFTVASEWRTPPELEQYAGAFRTVYRKHSANLLSLDAIQDYFQEVYWLKGKELDAHGLLESIKRPDGIPYEQLANRFRMIESNMQPVIVPYAEQSEEGEGLEFGSGQVESLVRALEYTESVGGIARKLQRYLVQVPEQGLKALMASGAVQPINPELYGHQFLLLENPSLYDRECGLSWDDPGFISAESAVI